MEVEKVVFPHYDRLVGEKEPILPITAPPFRDFSLFSLGSFNILRSLY